MFDSERRIELHIDSQAERIYLQAGILRSVSRAFYLSIRVLPADLREPIGLAYLLARTADTIVDKLLLTIHERRKVLSLFQEQLTDRTSEDVLREFSYKFEKVIVSESDQNLLEMLPKMWDMLQSLPESDADHVRRVVMTLTQGMKFDLDIFPSENAGEITAISTTEELDKYIYLVAGCVGEFWTDITMLHTPSLKEWDRELMTERGVRFGKALQLTNILRDLPKDLLIGRCYLPVDKLAAEGLNPADLLDKTNSRTARPALVDGIEMALDHFNGAEDYILAIPRQKLRLRLATLWPMLIGLGTLGVLARNQVWLDPERPSKVRRRWVYYMMAGSVIGAQSDSMVRAWIARLRSSVISYIRSS